MVRKRKSNRTKRRAREALAPKLIGAGLVLSVVPLFLGTSPVAAGLRPLAPLGWLMFALGCGLLWRQIRRQAASLPVAPTAGMSLLPERPLMRTSDPQPVKQRVVSIPERDPSFTPPQTSHAGGAHNTWGPAVFEVIEWRRFEALVEALFSQAGFETKSQSHGADEGVDIWLYSKNKPGTPVSVVQCKHWKGKRVGVDKVRELRGVMAAKHVTRGQFATTSTFTLDAEAFAKGNGINLLDINGLLALIAKRTDEQQSALLRVALEGDYWRPTCVNCGVKMVERSPRKGGSPFWGCAGYPRCKTTMPIARSPAGHPAQDLALEHEA